MPKSVSRGIELETTWTPIDHLTILFNYSYLDSYVTNGTGEDPADPNAYGPNAHPMFTGAQCLAGALSAIAAHNLGASPCAVDIYTETQAQATALQNATFCASKSAPPPPNPCIPPAPPVGVYSAPIPGDPGQGWNIPQNLKGNRLLNAPKNKIAVNVLYDFKTDFGSFTPAVSYVWRDKQYGLFFTEPFWAAPAWDEWDARLSYTSPNGKFVAIAFIKNIGGSIGYDQGPIASRAAGSVALLQPNGQYATVNYVQGVNGPVGFNNHLIGSNNMGIFQTLYPTPPRLYGLELHYKFF